MIYVLVMSALRQPFMARFQANQSTWDWFESKGIKVLKVVGDENLQEPILVDNLLYVPVKDQWENIGIKLWWALHLILKDDSITGIYRLDDDVQIKSVQEAEEVIIKLSKKDYGSLGMGTTTKGIPIKYAQTRVASTSPWKVASLHVSRSFPYASGSFMFLSRSSMEILSSFKSLIEFSQNPIEDITIGQIMCNKLVPLTLLTSSAFEWGHLDHTVGSSEDEFK